MVTPPAWLTVDDVGAYLDLPAAVIIDDDNLELSTAAVKAAVERRRSDLDFTLADFAVVHADVKGGSVIWAALVYQTRSAPSGFAGYGDETWLVDSLGSRRSEVLRMVGWRRPVVA
jgi:hypothetical protein